jgi:hypothetical protein
MIFLPAAVLSASKESMTPSKAAENGVPVHSAFINPRAIALRAHERKVRLKDPTNTGFLI